MEKTLAEKQRELDEAQGEWVQRYVALEREKKRKGLPRSWEHVESFAAGRPFYVVLLGEEDVGELEKTLKGMETEGVKWVVFYQTVGKFPKVCVGMVRGPLKTFFGSNDSMWGLMLWDVHQVAREGR